MGKYWLVKIAVLLVALVGVVYLMNSLRKPNNQLHEVFDQNIPAKVITQPPNAPDAPAGH